MAATDVTPALAGTLTDFVIKAIQLGFLGFGALLFVMVFIILFRNQPADAKTARLRSTFLWLGFASFVLAGIAQLATPILAPKPAAGPYEVAVAFSPKLSAAQLPEPTMTVLPQNL